LAHFTRTPQLQLPACPLLARGPRGSSSLYVCSVDATLRMAFRACFCRLRCAARFFLYSVVRRHTLRAALRRASARQASRWDSEVLKDKRRCSCSCQLPYSCTLSSLIGHNAQHRLCASALPLTRLVRRSWCCWGSSAGGTLGGPRLGSVLVPLLEAPGLRLPGPTHAPLPPPLLCVAQSDARRSASRPRPASSPPVPETPPPPPEKLGNHLKVVSNEATCSGHQSS